LFLSTAAERAWEDLYTKNKEMSLEMERLRHENTEFCLKNKELTLGMERLKGENMEFSPKTKELTLEIDNHNKNQSKMKLVRPETDYVCLFIGTISGAHNCHTLAVTVGPDKLLEQWTRT
jgi:hypothetical protein